MYILPSVLGPSCFFYKKNQLYNPEADTFLWYNTAAFLGRVTILVLN